MEEHDIGRKITKVVGRRVGEGGWVAGQRA
jgi:hypothetical protein